MEALVKINARMRGRQGPARAIADLRAAGFEVEVKHWRSWNQDGDRFRGTEADALSRGYSRANLEPRGGVTFVNVWHTVKKAGGHGAANCSDADNFDRRRGLRMALGRALKDAERQMVKRFHDDPVSTEAMHLLTRV
jgi:hypothetical protein